MVKYKLGGNSGNSGTGNSGTDGTFSGSWLAAICLQRNPARGVTLAEESEGFRMPRPPTHRTPEKTPSATVSTHNVNMAAGPSTIAPELLQRVIWIQRLTLVWMSVEALVSLAAAWTARSPALLAFGGDSAVELLSAAVVFRRFTSPSNRELSEERASRIAAGLLFVLAAFVLAASALTLLGKAEARPSPIGIALLVVAAVAMPWLAAQKRQLSVATSSAALRADAAESSVCGYLAVIALAGLVTNAVWKVTWADAVAALTLLPLIVREGWEASKGKPCC